MPMLPWQKVTAHKAASSTGRVTAIVLRGRDAELRCIETRPKQGDAQPTLLGSAATAAAAVDSLEAAQRLCHDVPR